MPKAPSADADGGEPQPVAGGGLLHRRALLHRGLVLASATAAGTAAAQTGTDTGESRPPWMRTPGQPFTSYGQPSKHEAALMRTIAGNRLLPGNGVSWTPLEDLEGMITPSGLHFERHHNGVPQIDPKQHRLLIHGLVKQPLQFAVADLERYPMRSHLGFIECGGNSNAGWHPEPIQRSVGGFHGLVSCNEWTGVPVSVLLNEAGLDPKAAWAIAEGGDAFAMNVSLPLAKLMDDALVALYQNGEPIRPEHGYPLRLVVPGWEGVLNVKWLRRLHLSAEPVMARNETAKYTELQPDGHARQFTFVMEAKSLITSPSPGLRMHGPNVYEIRGLAWSGHGRIRKVEVSVDGSSSWATAALQDPVLPRCFTRFRAAWRWDGKPAVLKSRATDETGYVQPEREMLVQERGLNGYFHYNAIVAWAVDAEGALTHVYA
ncbi:MAG: sulfite dehydrogenase [Methylibium sp.]|uniref:sulfite dehydrogenase n=1 Tax=Methylibium sp. TaxID=2067992 RepID=UPI001814B418|nr:sulfite dehydrogenase [Methylibium sp.]MBA3598119.1 sulfite dehydrogenase [Methylibium sp.]